MQAAVRAINADPSLSQEEKSRRIRELFLQVSNVAVQTATTQASTKTCKHYRRNCDIETPCCDKWYACRICHDEAESGHTLVRASTKRMRCRLCSLVQPVSSGCANKECEWKSTRYYCERCRLWEDNPEKLIYHCEGCGICRVGKREDYWHCDNCNLCLPNKTQSEHHCIKGAADDACVCGEYMQTSTRSLCLLPCGHTMHCDCRDNLIRADNIACPKCRKSIVRDRRFERALRAQIRLNPMPVEHRRKCQILCNDCQSKTIAKLHWMGIPCKQCGSFNTAIIETMVPSADDVEEEDEEDQELDEPDGVELELGSGSLEGEDADDQEDGEDGAVDDEEDEEDDEDDHHTGAPNADDLDLD